MALRHIFTDDDECLYKVCKPVQRFDARLHTLLDDMADTMYKADGVGLAASQIGILRRAFIVDCGEGLIEAINPEIVRVSGEQGGMEGCLSFPGKFEYVVRPNYVTIRAFDRFGNPFERSGEGLLARALLHESDHLDGHIFLEKAVEPPEDFDTGKDEYSTDKTGIIE